MKKYKIELTASEVSYIAYALGYSEQESISERILEKILIALDSDGECYE